MMGMMESTHIAVGFGAGLVVVIFLAAVAMYIWASRRDR